MRVNLHRPSQPLFPESCSAIRGRVATVTGKRTSERQSGVKLLSVPPKLSHRYWQ